MLFLKAIASRETVREVRVNERVEQAVVVLLSLAGVGSGIGRRHGKDLFRSTLFFGAFLVVMSGLYFSLEASFIAIMQIFVYVGGVVVMILFGIMLTGRDGVQLSAVGGRRAAVLLPVLMFGGNDVFGDRQVCLADYSMRCPSWPSES